MKTKTALLIACTLFISVINLQSVVCNSEPNFLQVFFDELFSEKPSAKKLVNIILGNKDEKAAPILLDFISEKTGIRFILNAESPREYKFDSITKRTTVASLQDATRDFTSSVGQLYQELYR